MRPIKFAVIERELLERAVSEGAHKRVQRKAMRLVIESVPDPEDDETFGNNSFFTTHFAVFLPASEYDNYPVGGEFLLISKETKG
jgi:hypothetical protein